jgi:glutathione S-transferase
MKLYYSPGACSIGIHVLLEELGKPYTVERVDLAAQAQYAPDFVAINPKSKVPTLVRDNGTVVTEFPAIAYWLARTNPDYHLLPDGAEAESAALELMDYAVATIHMQGFARVFRPANFSPNAADEEKVRERGVQILTKGFTLMDHALEGRDYLLDKFSIADAALFYVEFWGGKRMKMTLPPNCAAHLERMMARPAVQRVMQQEGLAV